MNVYNKTLSVVLYALTLLVTSSCSSEQMEPVSRTDIGVDVPNVFESAPASSQVESEPTTSSEHHHAIIQELLQDGRYTMLRVSEAGEEHWLITRVEGLNVGDHVDYHEGLVKEQYRNTTLDRTFDRVILVSSLELAHSADGHSADGYLPTQTKKVANTTISAIEGVLTPAEFLDKSPELEGQVVRVQGVVVKVNANIMKRHWLHLSETMNGPSDVVITSQTVVPVGHEVVFEGKVVRNKDFGAGYVFETLLENAVAL